MTSYLVFKLIFTSIIVLLVSEISKQSSFLGSIFASIPLISVLAMIWLYIDTKDISRVIDLSRGIFWLVIPSLTLFILLPILLKFGFNFYVSLIVSIGATAFSYYFIVIILNNFGIKL